MMRRMGWRYIPGRSGSWSLFFFHYDIELTSRIAPPAAAINTTSQGGNLQLIKATKQVSASAKSRGEPIALIQSGS